MSATATDRVIVRASSYASALPPLPESDDDAYFRAVAHGLIEPFGRTMGRSPAAGMEDVAVRALGALIAVERRRADRARTTALNQTEGPNDDPCVMNLAACQRVCQRGKRGCMVNHTTPSDKEQAPDA